MKKYLKLFMEFLKSQEGASAVEYGLLVGLIALVTAVAMTAMGSNINNLFTSLTDFLKSSGS